MSSIQSVIVSGPIQKKSSMSEDSSSDTMELEESAMVVDPNLEANLQRLREEEKVLLEQQATMEAGQCDDIAALEHQDLLRLNHLQQRELKKQQAAVAARAARAQAEAAGGADAAGAGAAAAGAPTPGVATGAVSRRDPRRRTCTVRVNNLHAACAAAEALETDV